MEREWLGYSPNAVKNKLIVHTSHYGLVVLGEDIANQAHIG